MADIEIIAHYCESLDESDDRFAAFAASDDPEEGYALFRAEPQGLWLEVSDEMFGAFDAIEDLTLEERRIRLVLRPAMVQRFGMIRSVEIRPARDCQGWDEALAQLRLLLG